MPIKKLTQEIAIKNLIEVHGDEYDYSKSIFTRTKDKILIVCKRHGEFSQIYSVHKRGSGCPRCLDIHRVREYDPNEKSVYGVGFRPTRYPSHDSNGRITKEYNTWSGMMTRCYNPKYKLNKPTYNTAEVCDDWLHADNFMDWCQTQVGFGVEGFQLDKDILNKGNKLYSPENCAFVPAEVNSQLTKADARRGEFPIGVSWHTYHCKFSACMRTDNKTKHLGYFSTPEQAFLAYKVSKEAHLKIIAERYKDSIDERVYVALCNYKVEITD